MKTISACNILVVDDDNDVLYTAKLVLKVLFARVDTLSRPGFIPDCLRWLNLLSSDRICFTV